MSHEKVRSLRSARLRDPATLKAVANWFRWARAALALTREQIATRIECSPRSYYAWETGEAAPPTTAYFAVKELLAAELNLDSSGRLRVA